MANVLLITHIYPPAIDGGSKVIAKIGDYLQSQGHQIKVLTTNCRSTDDFVKHNPNIIKQKNNNIYRLPVYTIFHKPLKLISKVFSKGPVFKLIPFNRFLITCLQFHPDYIIAGPLPTTVVIYANFIKKLTGAKLLINACFHPTDPDFQNRFLINSLRSADHLWTATDFETDYFHQNFKIPLSKMITVGNGVKKSFLFKNLKLEIRNSNNLLFVGSFASHKGITTLLDAFTKICQLKSDNFTLTLAGQPTLYSPVIESKIKSLPQKIKSKIRIIYNFPSSQLSTLVDSCSVLISPSTQESFGLVLIEAWARRKPVIASDIPPHKELITKSDGGLLFKTGNSADLATKILKLCSSKTLMTHSAASGYSYVKRHYIWDKIGNTLWQEISS